MKTSSNVTNTFTKHNGKKIINASLRFVQEFEYNKIQNFFLPPQQRWRRRPAELHLHREHQQRVAKRQEHGV